MAQPRSVRSVSEFLERVQRYHDLWSKDTFFPWRLWFRGEPYLRSPSSLRPKLYRPKVPRKWIRYEEQELRAEFRRHAASLMLGGQPNGPYAHWEWYFLMQHHGVLTRLLDWTDGSLVGLYFAISARRKRQGGDAAVYVLDPYWLNDRAFDDMRMGSNRPAGIVFPEFSDTWAEMSQYLSPSAFDRSRIRPEIPIAISPSHLSDRFAAQKSQFTIYGRSRTWLLEKTRQNDSRVKSIAIAKDSILSIRAELARCGISESAVFPDLDGLGRELHDEWEIRCC